MIGTFVNVGAIIIGSSVGALLNKGIKEEHKKTITQVIGLVAVALGMTWTVNNISESGEPLLFIISLVIGGLIGSLLKLDKRVSNFGEKLKKKSASGTNLIQGLTTAVLLFCVGTLSILGPMESALKSEHTLLFTNALLDGITSMILASTFGFGIIISAGILFVWQGSIYLAANVLSPFITPDILVQVSIIGGLLIFSTGINILQIKRIKTLNLLPALFLPPLYFIPFIYNTIQKISEVLQ